MTRRFNIVLILFLIALVGGCEGSGEPVGATGKVSLGALHHAEAGPYEISTADEAMRIDRFVIVVSAIELHLCEPDGTQSAWRWLDGVLVPAAQAHVPTSAMRLGVPNVEDVLDGSTSTRIFGEIAPPLGRYCRAWIVLAPADDDVMNLTDVETSAVESKTALLQGRYRPPGSAEWIEFTSTTDRVVTIPVDLFDPSTGDAPLVLDKGNDDVMLVFEKSVDPTMFQGLTREDRETNTAASRALDALTETFSLHRFGQ